MAFFRDALAIFRMEMTLFPRFPKLRISAVGVMLIPALYALIYLASVRDPGAHTGDLKAAIVNLDQGLDYRGQQVNMGQEMVTSLKQRHTFGFVDMAVEDDAKLAVRQGHMAFALIIPKDFSANAVPGQEAAGGRLQLYVSEGNNYNGAALAKRFAVELGHQVNTNLNEKRWSLVLSTATGSIDKLAQLRKGAAALQDGAHRVAGGVAKAESGSKALSTGADGLNTAVGQLTDGVKQLGAGLHTMDQQRPAAQDLAALKSGAAALVTGHAALGQGLQELQGGAQKLADGAEQLRDETKGIPLVGGKISAGAGQLANGATQLGTGLQSARNGQTQLADGTQKLSTGVDKLADGMAALGGGIHTAASKVPADAKLDELTHGEPGQRCTGFARWPDPTQSGLARTQRRTGYAQPILARRHQRPRRQCTRSGRFGGTGNRNRRPCSQQWGWVCPQFFGDFAVDGGGDVGIFVSPATPAAGCTAGLTPGAADGQTGHSDGHCGCTVGGHLADDAVPAEPAHRPPAAVHVYADLADPATVICRRRVTGGVEWGHLPDTQPLAAVYLRHQGPACDHVWRLQQRMVQPLAGHWAGGSLGLAFSLLCRDLEVCGAGRAPPGNGHLDLAPTLAHCVWFAALGRPCGET